MIRTMRRVRLLWLTLACATIASGLAGCGGGGGSTPTPPPPPPAPESAFLLAEFVAVDSNNQFVRVWDPANPSVAVQDVRIVQSNGIVWQSSHLVFSDATRWDAASRTVTTLGHAKVFFDNDGKLYSIDLRGGHAHAPVQLSSALDVSMPVRAWAMNAAGDDAWVDAQGGSHDWAIRTSMAGTAAPVNVRHVVAALRDASTGLPQLFFASLGDDGIHPVPATYEIADASFAPVQVPDVAAMVAADGWIGADPGQPGLAYVGIAGQVRVLRWSAGGVSVDAAGLHALSGLHMTAAVADARSVWIADGTTLLALGNGAVRPVGTFSVAPAMLMDAGGYIAADEITQVTGVTKIAQVETLDKASGARVLVEPASPELQLLAGGDDGVLLSNTSDQHDAYVLARGDGQARATIGAQAVGIVRSASGRPDQPAAPVGLLSCVAGATPGYCAAGRLTQFTLAGAGTSIGSNAATAAMLRSEAIAGLASALSGQNTLSSPAGFGDGQTDTRDAWQFTPGAAASLTRVTSSLP